MFNVTKLDDAIRGQIMSAERANDTSNLLRLVALLPLTSQEIESCAVLGASTQVFRDRRNQLFTEAWSSMPAAASAEIQSCDEQTLRSAQEVMALADRPTAAETILTVIGWRMAHEQLPQLEKVRQNLLEKRHYD